MSDISNSLSRTSSPFTTTSAGIAAGGRISGDTSTSRVAVATSGAARVDGDRVEVSEVARWLEEMNRLPSVRESKVSAARAAIADGSLDTDEKLSIAIQRMLDDVM